MAPLQVERSGGQSRCGHCACLCGWIVASHRLVALGVASVDVVEVVVVHVTVPPLVVVVVIVRNSRCLNISA